MTADKEKRRAISREAARRRRQVESDIFRDLSELLPVQRSVRSNLDKPSVIRLTLSYMRLHSVLKVNAASETWRSVKRNELLETGNEWRESYDGERETEEEEEEEAETNMYLDVLEGFLMVVSTQGEVIYLSDNVSTHMGLTQTELMGHNIIDFSHPCDHDEIRHHLRLMSEGVWNGPTRDFVLRVKSTQTHRGRSSNLKSATWKVLHCQGRVRPRSSPSALTCLLLTCKPLPLSHTLLSTHTFTSQHGMDMRFTYCDPRVTSLLGFSPDELLGRSVYDLCHPQDTECVRKNHLNSCLKTQSVSGQYRMLVRAGGFVWVESHSAVIPSVRASRSRSRNGSTCTQFCILCVTYVLSGVEEPTLQLSVDQQVLRPEAQHSSSNENRPILCHRF